MSGAYNQFSIKVKSHACARCGMIFKNVLFVLCPDCMAADERDRLEAMAYDEMFHAEEAGSLPADHDEILRQERMAETSSWEDSQDWQDFTQWKAEHDWEREHEGEDKNFSSDELARLDLWEEQERSDRPTPHSEFDL